MSLYSHLDKHWRSTCKILLGQDIGEMSEYAEWLYSGNGPRIMKKSSISGRCVVCSGDSYSPESRFISHEEVEIGRSYAPVSINDVKDIDSLIEAIKGRVAYSGNIVLGNSGFVEDSTTISDSFYVLHSERVAFSKNIAYSTRGGYSEGIFGCFGFGPVQFAIKSYGITESTRIFMSSKVDFSSDVYYSHGISNCADCIFSFNLRSRRHAIGNLSLPKDRYAELKKKLLAEMADKLRKNKRLDSIAELIKNGNPDYTLLESVKIHAHQIHAKKEEKYDKTKIELAFNQTTRVLLGTPLENIDTYANWLKKDSNILLEYGSSCLSEERIILPDYAGFIDYPPDRLLTQEEANVVGERLSLSEDQVKRLSLENSSEILQKIAYFCPFWFAGKLKNNIESPLNIDSSDCYSGILYIRSKSCAFSFSPRSCEYCFGSREGRHVSFSINSHFSTRVTRCFEVDHCSSCSDCYFCHNCENVRDSMFCFNVKNLRYGIGNCETDPKVYNIAKATLKHWILEILKEKNAINLSIFSISSANFCRT